MEQKPDLPHRGRNGAPLKPLTTLLIERRATAGFTDEPVPDDILRAILLAGAQAPSGWNLQPWRFIVVRDSATRNRLQRAAFNQAKVGEAPVTIVAFGSMAQTRRLKHDIFIDGARRGLGEESSVEELEHRADRFLASIEPAIWLNRHIMIAVTTLMLTAEAYGFDTAPMEGFDPEAIKRELELPADAMVAALLAIGVARTPDRPYPGRLPLAEIAFGERYGAKLELHPGPGSE